jgi:hypothetical protein
MSSRARRAAAVAATCLALAPAATAGGNFPGLPGNWSHAEINVTVAGQPHTMIYDRGRVKSASPTELVLRELDGSVVSIAVTPATIVEVDGVRRRMRAVQRGYLAIARRVDGGSADHLWVTSR